MGKLKTEYPCALILSHKLIGGKWKLRILWHIIHGDNRFALLLKAIPDITQKVLSSQLKELEKNHILKRTVIDDNPPKVVVYHIAEEYSELVSIIENVCTFTKGYAKNNRIKIED